MVVAGLTVAIAAAVLLGSLVFGIEPQRKANPEGVPAINCGVACVSQGDERP